ncbi:MAG: right-handed parallel beta-helix repeat-containing protein [Candidatus Bipolaricaulota bacterium]|nr:right-handed parallel beta-helix repeat-containing protein [Candidatus Bipolaricaulota bacterium]MDW8127177.1 NosD domain-containing protein [Candidatus Bipolaricaulota bacterium]
MRWWGVLFAMALAVAGLAQVVTRGPIVIRSESDLYGLAKGFGTNLSPFVIEGLRIDANAEPFGILIANFSHPLVLRNLEVYGASIAAIRLQNVQNVSLENVVVRGSATGIFLSGSRKITLKGCRIENCGDGMRLMFAETITIEGITVSKAEIGIWFQGTRSASLSRSTIRDCGLGLLFELESAGNVVAENAFLNNQVHAYSEGRNQFDNGKRGNFWEGFVAEDREGDGIFDQAYFIGSDTDRFPLVSPP